MKKSLKPRSSVLTVAAATVAIVLLGGGGAVAGSLVTSAKIKNNTIQSIDVRNNALAGADVKDESLTGSDVKNFSLSNQDVGVLFAQVNANATVANSSGNVTALQPFGAGTYEVDFHRDISSCAFTATVGDAAPGSTDGIVVTATDRSSNPGAVYLKTTDISSAAANKPFQLVVVC